MGTRIRVATKADGEALSVIYAPSVSAAAISFEVTPPDAAEMARRVEAMLSRQIPWLVMERAGAVCGFAYASPHNERPAYDWSVNVSVYVAESHRGQSVGRSLYTALFDLLRRQGFYVAHAGITLPNAASVGLHEAMGFRRVGVYESVGYKLGAWRDVGWWRLELQPCIGEPKATRALIDVLPIA